MVLGHVIKDGERTQDIRTLQNITFDSMLLALDTLRGLKLAGFYKPSPIQLHGIPLGKCGFDLLLEAKSGTGKTAVFSVITLEKIDLNKGLQTIILAPTREIAAQICDVIRQIGSHYKGLKVEVVMGGIPVHEDIEKFKNGKVHIVVGSPGRLKHLIQDKHIDVSTIRLLVLDEADKLMEKSFLVDINFIFASLPKQKQVIMSSATYPEITKTFINKYVQNAQHVCPDTNSILLGIKQRVTFVKHNSNIVKQTKNRFEELLKILSKHSFKQCLIFCNYQARIAELHKMLKREKWPAHQLYGQQEQLDRLDALKSLQEYKCRILISTDLAARGIDASNVDLVINFEPPYEWQTYLHRIGRAGRFGSYGTAITILSEGNEQKKFAQTLDAIKAPINLCNLWTDGECKGMELNSDKLNNGTSNTFIHSTVGSPEVATDIKITEKYEELWNMINCDIKQDKELNVDSFENLCQSYEQPEIESFSELMSSHQVHITTGIDSTYINLPMQQMSFTNYFKQAYEKLIHKEKIIKECSNESNNKLSSGKSVNNVEQEIPNALNENIKTTVINSDNPRCVEYEHLEQCGKSVKKEYTKSEVEYYIPNTDEDLLKAGLPTAFGSSKIKNINKRNSITETLPNIEKIDTFPVQLDLCSKQPVLNTVKTNSSRIENCYTNWKSKIINKQQHKFPKSLSSAVSSNTSDERKDCASTYKRCQYTLHNYTKNDAKRYHNEYHKSETRTTKSHQDYIGWYNNLKFTMKHIQHAIYIDEMLKL